MTEETEIDEKELAERLKVARLERIRKATEEIQVILDKYHVQLQAYAEIPASRIYIVPRDDSA